MKVTVGFLLPTVSVPDPVAKSEVDVAALTVNDVVPAGVVPEVVEIVSVDVLELSADVNVTGFALKEALAPAGNAVVMLRVALKFPLEPPPVPRNTVIVKAALEPGVTGSGDCAPTVTEPTLGLSRNVVCATDPEVWPVAVR